MRVPARDRADILQEVLLAAYRRLASYRPRARARDGTEESGAGAEGTEQEGGEPGAQSREEVTNARAWLFGIAWRQVRYYRRPAYRRREIPSGLPDMRPLAVADTAPGPEEHTAKDERFMLASRVLADIRPEWRAVLILKDVFEMPIPEIAALLKIKENTAWDRLRRARVDFAAATKRLPAEERSTLLGALRALWIAPWTLLHALVNGRAEPDAVVAPAPCIASACWKGAGGLRAPWCAFASLGRRALRAAAGLSAGAAAIFVPQPWSDGWRERPGAIGEASAATDRTEEAAPREIAPSGDEGSELGKGEKPSAAAAAATRPSAAAAAIERDPLAEEQRLLTAAREALGRRDIAAAIEPITTHARQFPRGQLATLRRELFRQALQLEALRSAGGGASGAQ
jgi:DNA-directed RNA polymerase specialized sigma24 family protein